MISFVHVQSLLVLFISLTAAESSQVTRSADLPAPVAYFPLNGKYKGNELKNRVEGIPGFVSYASGPEGEPEGSMQFYAKKESFLLIKNTGQLSIKHSISIAFWVYPERLSCYCPIVEWKSGLQFWMRHDQKFQARYIFQGSPQIFTEILLSQKLLQANAWYHFATSYNHLTGIAELWVDGKLAAKTKLDVSSAAELYTLYWVEVGFKFPGRIAQLQFYDVALTGDQFKAAQHLPTVTDVCAEKKPCQNGAECENEGEGYKCKCKEGFEGINCETDVNECQTLKPCKNGGNCVNKDGGYTCQCPEGFKGTNCEEEVSGCELHSVECFNGGACEPIGTGYKCNCQEGYIGRHCEWKRTGCYKESKSSKFKAMAKVFKVIKKNWRDERTVVESCMNHADAKGYKVFGVRSSKKCVTTKGLEDFSRYGPSKDCQMKGEFGVGKGLANFVYVMEKKA